jgi:hypothetical protein
MTKRDLKVDIHRGYGRVDQVTVFADPDEPTQVRDAVRAHLEAEHWDRGLWHEFKARWMRNWGCDEVRAD